MADTSLSPKIRCALDRRIFADVIVYFFLISIRLNS